MRGKKYSLGIDFGTLSCRALLAEIKTGKEIAVSVFCYPHKVLDELLPDMVTKLPPDWALQHPQDYLDAVAFTVPEVIKKSGVNAEDIIGVGVDFTASTVIPVLKDGTPLCFLPEYKSSPHSYVKLWKHHSAQDKADKINETAKHLGEKWLKLYGGKISSESLIPKVWQVLDEAPEIYEKADKFIEAADWIVWQLTGQETRNSCAAGYDALWNKEEGYPSKEFFKALDTRLKNIVEEKLSGKIISIGQKAGEITKKTSEITGLKAGTPVAAGIIDAHVTVAAVGLHKAGQLLIVMGTSNCHMTLKEDEIIVPGICGVIEDGIMPGFFGYEAGQSCAGDHFSWFIENCLPSSYTEEATAKGISIFELLNNKASALKAGESGLIALDWWNGNHSVLVDFDLTGLILGMTLATKPEEIYRALIEATAFGTRMIIENFKENGVPINEIFAAGGIAEKNSFAMQIYTDVLGMDIKISGSAQAPALGSAIFGAAAAGKERGGYDSVVEASKVMGKIKEKVYKPIPKNVEIYNKLYTEYKLLHDYFGRGSNNVMKRLKEIKKSVKS